MTTMVIGAKPKFGSPPPDIILDDPYVSTYHAKATRRDDGTVWIEDMGSINGTYLNGVRVSAPTQMFTGDKMRIGRTEVTMPRTIWPA
jgi:pSer/pThr/pTyr-binding forkhead associated (FHA) protein